MESYIFDLYFNDNDGKCVLHYAAEAGHLELFQYLIEKGGDVDRQSRYGKNCLHIAAENGHFRLCKVLLENYNLDLHMKDDFGSFVLYFAAEAGNLELFQYLIKKGGDVYRQNMFGLNCLHRAALFGHFRLCKVLLENYNFDLYMKDNGGQCVVHYASYNGSLELFQYLVEKGSNVYRQTNDGMNCLHIAAWNGNFRLCKLLLWNYNFDVHMSDDDGKCVIHYASENVNLELFQFLVEKGSNVYRQTRDGTNCLHMAASIGHFRLCKVLLENYNLEIHMNNDDGKSVIHDAASNGDLELFQYLIEKGCDVYKKCKDGRDCLHIAASNGRFRLCKVLLENYNFDLNMSDDDGKCAIHYAAENGDLELFQYLIENGSNVYKQTRLGTNCLHIAAWNGNLCLCEVLLENYNFDIHMSNDDGKGVLHYAAENGNLALFQFLVTKGSNVYRQTRHGTNCLHSATWNGHFRLCEVLLENYNFNIHINNDDGKSVVHDAAFNGDLELFQHLIKKSGGVYKKSKDGKDCLHIVARNGHFRLCKILLENYNFDIHSKDDDGWSVIHCAAQNGDLELFKYLIEQGSDVYSQTKNDMNCLHMAALCGCFRLCEILLENYNFDINFSDENDRNVLHFAVESGNIELCQYIIEKGIDVYSKKKDGINCLHIAALNGHLRLCKALLQNYNFNLHMASDSGMNALLFAAEGGNLELCQYLIEKGSNVNSATMNNTNCLLAGASQGRLRLCKALLENFKFEIHMQNNKGFNALLYAAESGSLEMFTYFLEKGCYVSSKTKDNRDCLQIAASKGNSSLCKSLLKFYGFRINMRCDRGWAAIHYATESGDLDLIKYFVEKGSNIYWTTKNNTNCLQIAASRGHMKLCKLLLEEYKFDIFSTNENGWNVLHYAARSGDLKLLQLFTQNGIDIYSKTKLNSNCLHIAATNGHLNLCKTLVEVYNFDIFTKNDKGWSVLNSTAKSGNLELFQYFIQLGADVYNKTNCNYTCLHIAAYYGHLNICRNIFDLYQSDLKRKTTGKFGDLHKCNGIYKRRLLKDKKYFLNLRDLSGYTYLHYASFGGHTSICKLLLGQDVDVTCRNRKGKTARDIAIKEKNQNVLDVLKEKYDPLGK